jgi:hypothetical protein
MGSKSHKIATCAIVFHCTKAISWIIKHANLDKKHVINARGQKFDSFQPSVITACCHLDEGEKSLDEEMVKEFLNSPRDLLKIWCKLGKHFKTMSSNEYPTNSLRLTYKYAMTMLCRIYGEPYE